MHISNKPYPTICLLYWLRTLNPQADVQYVLSSVLSALKLPIDKAAFLSSGITQGEDLVCAAICPLHGPVVRSSVTELVREYRVVSVFYLWNVRNHLSFSHLNQLDICKFHWLETSRSLKLEMWLRFCNGHVGLLSFIHSLHRLSVLQWTEKKLKEVEEATIAVIYASAYGNTAALAQAIRLGSCWT